MVAAFVGSFVQLVSKLSVFVLLSAPDGIRFLGSHFIDGGIQLLNGFIGDLLAVRLCKFQLRVMGQLVEHIIGSLESIAGDVAVLG